MRFYEIVAAFMRRDGEVLVVRQETPSGVKPYWTVPAGRVEAGENLLEALAREVREETGLHSGTPAHLNYLAEGSSEKNQTRWKSFGFEVTEFSGKIAPNDPDARILEARFLPLEEAAARIDEYVPYEVMRKPVISCLLHPERYRGSFWEFHQDPAGEQRLIQQF